MNRGIAALLVVLAGALAFEAWWLSLTVDEPSHLISSYLYWRGRDRLYPRDMPPLIKIVGGFPSVFMRLPVAADLGAPGDRRSEWGEGGDLVRRVPPEKLQRWLFFSRLPLIVFPLLTTWLLWRWGSELFGPGTGLSIAALWAISPVPLGHGALFKNDHAAAFTYLFFWYSAWRFSTKPKCTTVLLVGLAAGLAVISKLSMLFVWPMAVAVVVLFGWRRPLWVLATAVVPYAVVLTAYQFDGVPIPEGMRVGVEALMKSNAAHVPVYLLGQVYPQGHRAYFLLATLLKMPFPVLVLLATGLIIALRRRPRLHDALWIAPGLLYFALASFSSLHLGVRLVLPAWAMMMLLAGPAIEWMRAARLRETALAAGFASVLLMSIATYPNGLAFFNPFVGDQRQALRYLADSNIDWGQALRDAAVFAERNKIEKLRFAWFGFDSPERFFKPGQVELIAPPWNDKLVRGDRLRLEPGWYAASASLLPGHFFMPQYRDYYFELLRRKPDGVAGGSIFFYRVLP